MAWDRSVRLLASPCPAGPVRLSAKGTISGTQFSFGLESHWQSQVFYCYRSGTACRPRLKPDFFALSLRESAAMRVAGAARQRDGLCEIHSYFTDRMRIRRKSNRDAFLIRHLNNFGTRVNLFAILAQSGGVKFHRQPIFLRGFQEFADQRRDILVRIETEFLAQVRMRDDFEQAGFRCERQALEVSRPHLIWIVPLPFGSFHWAVHIPRIGDVMDGTDEIIPGMAPCQLTNPAFVAGNEINFHCQFDCQ